jgi:hypothetical protein
MPFCDLMALFINHRITFHCLDISWIVYLYIEEQLGCFQLLASMNQASMNIHVRFFCGHKFSAPLGEYYTA